MKHVMKMMTLLAGDEEEGDFNLPGAHLHIPYSQPLLFHHGHHLQKLLINVSMKRRHY
jgi:hypothetical protein